MKPTFIVLSILKGCFLKDCLLITNVKIKTEFELQIVIESTLFLVLIYSSV